MLWEVKMAKNKEKLWLKCVNLGSNPNTTDIEEVFKSIKMGDLDFDNLGGIAHYELDKYPVAYPSIQAFQKWHLSFYSIFDHWLKYKDLTDDQAEWIDKQILDFTLKFRKTPLPEHPFDLTLMQESQMIMKFIVTQFAEILASESEIRQCEAEDCQRYFIPNPSGKEQRFCSNACKQKAYRKRKNSP